MYEKEVTEAGIVIGKQQYDQAEKWMREAIDEFIGLHHLDKDKRKVSLSIKELEKHNEKIAIEKYGKDGSSSGAVLGDILGKVFKSKKKKEKK